MHGTWGQGISYSKDGWHVNGMPVGVCAKNHITIWSGISKSAQHAHQWYCSTHVRIRTVYLSISWGRRLHPVFDGRYTPWSILFCVYTCQVFRESSCSSWGGCATIVEFHLEHQAFWFKIWVTWWNTYSYCTCWCKLEWRYCSKEVCEWLFEDDR